MEKINERNREKACFMFRINRFKLVGEIKHISNKKNQTYFKLESNIFQIEIKTWLKTTHKETKAVPNLSLRKKSIKVKRENTITFRRLQSNESPLSFLFFSVLLKRKKILFWLSLFLSLPRLQYVFFPPDDPLAIHASNSQNFSQSSNACLLFHIFFFSPVYITP